MASGWFYESDEESWYLPNGDLPDEYDELNNNDNKNKLQSVVDLHEYHHFPIPYHGVDVGEVDYHLYSQQTPEEKILEEFKQQNNKQNHHKPQQDNNIKQSLLTTALNAKNYEAFDYLLNTAQQIYGFVDVNILYDVIECGEYDLFLALINN